MNHWLFILIAYGLTLAATAALGGWSYAAMRRAEGEAERLRPRR